jgi:hypothetical protein
MNGSDQNVGIGKAGIGGYVSRKVVSASFVPATSTRYSTPRILELSITNCDPRFMIDGRAVKQSSCRYGDDRLAISNADNR